MALPGSCDMSENKGTFSDELVEQIIGNLLRITVILAASVVFVGGIIYLIHHGMDSANYSMFNGEPRYLRTLAGILKDTLAFHSRGIIQLGLLLLIATPVLRVLFSIFAFAVQRDRLYVLVTLLVFTLLIFSIAGGHF